MAEEMNPNDSQETKEKELTKEERKEQKRREKEEKKLAKKKGGKQGEDQDEEEEKTTGKVVIFFVTLLIILIWLGIIAILIKTDVGGFGSSVLSPMLKNVPYVNKILPASSEAVTDGSQTTEEYPYESLNDAINRIKELEVEVDNAAATKQQDDATIADLQAQVDDLSKYKDEQAAFEDEKEKFYEDVVFSDQAPDISQYKAYYESIDPANAEVLYKQVVEQLTYDSEVEDYAKTYASMKPKEAAAIFDTMTDNLSLVANILSAMDTQSRADILGKMNSDTAAQVTKLLEPQQQQQQ